MKTIRQGDDSYEAFTFPDGQTHIRLKDVADIEQQDQIRIVWPIRNPQELFQLAQVADAVLYHKKREAWFELYIPYLMGARSDRRMVPGDSFDLLLVGEIINLMQFKSVFIFDPHSRVATEMISNSSPIVPENLVRSYKRDELQPAVLICPDAGAQFKTLHYATWTHINEIVHCEKKRDLSSGSITLKVVNPEVCQNKECVIIDDICDGGATFIEIAKQIKPKRLTLIVSHGIFSKGFVVLRQYFDEIITTDSYASTWPGIFQPRVIPLNV